MRGFENTFIRGPSPSYSDEVISENAMSNTLPMSCGGEEQQHQHYNPNMNYLSDKFPYYMHKNLSAHQERSALVFWVAISVLLVLTVGNLILTLTIIGILHLGRGMQGMELIPEQDIIKFYGVTDLDRILTKSNSDIEGFSDVPVSITGDDGAVHVRLHRNGPPHNRLIVDKDGIQFRGINSFELKDPINNNNIFSTHRPNYNMPSGGENLIAKLISASRVSSAIHQPLSFDTDARLSIKGSEGIFIDAYGILLQAEHNIAFNATLNGGISLEANDGIFLNMDKIPIVSPELGLRTGSVQYKICACMPQGSLYRIPVPRVHNGPKITCTHYGAEFNPCAAI